MNGSREGQRYDALRTAAAIVGLVCAVVGSYIAARFAPYAPMRHAMVLGLVGLVLSTAGAIATIPMNLGPAWYPIALVLTALPCAWLGER